MENVSRLTPKKRYPLEIAIQPYLYDHHLEGKTFFPAVEALITLAKAVKINAPQTSINILSDGIFPHFLVIPPEAKVLAAFADIEEDNAGEISAALLTSVKSKTGTISRIIEHARVRFAAAAMNQFPTHPFRALEKLAGQCINVPAAAIYRELVSFGQAYQNITGDLSIAYEGALAYFSGGDTGADDDPLGSPFPFDAIMQAACVWAQRFTGTVPFPIGFAKRTIYQKTKKRVTYLGRIAPVQTDREPFVFDAWIFDLQGAICEEVAGIQMRDVTRGRLKPPAWIKETTS